MTKLLILELGHILGPIRSTPALVAAMEIIRADLAEQAAGLEEMERNGELLALPW